MRRHRALILPAIPGILSLLACLGGKDEETKPAYAGLQQLTVVNALAMEGAPAAVDMWIVDDDEAFVFAEGVPLGTASEPAKVLVSGGVITVRLTAAGAGAGDALIELELDTDGDDTVLIAHPVMGEAADSGGDSGAPEPELVATVSLFDVSEDDTAPSNAEKHRLHMHLGGIIGAVADSGARVGWATTDADNCTAPLEATDPVHQLNPPAGDIVLALYGADDAECATRLGSGIDVRSADPGDATLLVAWGADPDSIDMLAIDLEPPTAEE
jgi:hypothetical protein